MEILEKAGMYLALLYVTGVVLFGCYIVAMSLKGAKMRDKLTKLDIALGWPWVPVAVIVDFLANMLLSVVFLDPPQELLVTHRLRRYRTHSRYDGWRREWATKICRRISKYDPDGAHC